MLEVGSLLLFRLHARGLLLDRRLVHSTPKRLWGSILAAFPPGVCVCVSAAAWSPVAAGVVAPVLRSCVVALAAAR